MTKEYTIEQATSIHRMLHDAFMRGFAYGLLNKPTKAELLKQADEEVERVIEYEKEFYSEDDKRRESGHF